jgi:hypothetical protein
VPRALSESGLVDGVDVPAMGDAVLLQAAFTSLYEHAHE